MPDPIFITLEDVMEVHEKAIEAFGGSSGIRDQGALEAAINAPQNHDYYNRAIQTEELTQTDILVCAAVYLHHISEAQAFVDGNKRTAVAITLMFLLSNNVGVINDQKGLYDLCMKVANHELNIDQIGVALQNFVQS